MGLEYVKRLSAIGYNVIIAALPGRPGEVSSPSEVALMMKKEYPEQDFFPVEIDLARTQAGDELFAEIERERPGAFVEVLINNAGFISIKHFRDIDEETVKKEILLHNVTTVTLCHKFLPAMSARGCGYVLNISSLTAWLPYPFISIYSATKAFNRCFTRALRSEYRSSGVEVATVYFGAVDTPLYKLSPSRRSLMRKLGVMITPGEAACKALDMLFAGRSGLMPGLVNKLAYLFCPVILPRPVVVLIDKIITKRLKLDKK